MTDSWYADLPKFYQRQIAAAGLDTAGLTRRRVLQGIAAGAALAAAPARAAGSLDYMTWEGYNDPKIIDPFRAKTGAEVSFDFIIDSPGGFAKLQAGASRVVDLISTDMPWVTRMGPAGLALELDPAEFTAVTDTFYPQFKPPYAPLQHEGKTIGVATRWGWVGACVNTDHDKVEAWRTYDPAFDAKNKGRICVMDWGDWPILPVALHVGVDPYAELDEAALNEVRLGLRALFKNTKTIIGDLTLAQKGLLDGSLTGCIGAGSYLTSALRKQGHRNILAVVPEPKGGLKQGIVWVEATAVLKDSHDPALAKTLLSHVVSKESGKALSLLDSTSNVVTNQAVETLYSADERDILQMDYMWTAFDNSQMHRIAPNIDEMLAIWGEELAAAN